MVVYFSGTGNSKYVAERIVGSLQEKLICMNERIKSGDTGSVKTGENLVVVVPTYAWRIPRSPVLNGQGELIGINFDRNWEGVGGDIQYLPDYQRSIIVDIRYVLFVIDKYAGAGYLLNEMEFSR